MTKNIVVIEADSFRLEGIIAFLSNVLNYDIRTARDARSGWFLITESPPEVVILNISLNPDEFGTNNDEPKESHGLALAKEIKQFFPDIGLILIGNDIKQFQPHTALLRHQYGESVQTIDTTNSMNHLEEVMTQLDQQQLPSVPSLNEEERQRLATHLWAMLGDAERPWIEMCVTNMNKLTTREWQVVMLLGQSLSAQGIAHKLTLSRNSVDNIISRIYFKLGLSVLRQSAPELRPMLILIKANTLYTLKRPDA